MATNSQINDLTQQSKGFFPNRQPLMSFLALSPSTHAPYIPKPEVPLPDRQLGFLTLAPTVSVSHPKIRHHSISHLIRPLPLTHGHHEPVALDAATTTMPTTFESEPKARRSSSISSDGSLNEKKGRLRFLKLGPVHWGEHQGSHKEDFHVVEEEVISPQSQS